MKLFLVSIFFCFLLSWLQAEPVAQMIRNGATPSEERLFHLISAAGRISFALLVYYYNQRDWKRGLASLLFQWAAFDILLNLFEHHQIFYVGRTAGTDIFIGYLGQWAGEIKTAVCLAIGWILMIIN